MELAALSGNGIAVRDSKRPYGPVLRFTTAELNAFRTSLKDGDLTA
ncbi:DUF397 domain-containing protein [Sphaerisporangium viridialbum]